jgi:hypothetical protein
MVLAAPAAAAQHATPAFDLMQRRLGAVRSYSLTVAAHEVDGSTADDRTLHLDFDEPDHATAVVVSGKGKGTSLVWSGGSRVRIRGGLFSLLPITLDLHDPRITSPRGNTILRAEISPILRCFAAHRDALSEATGPKVDGHATDVITLQVPGGIRCAGDAPKDSGVTRDVLTVRRDDSLPVRRERYVGDTLVERWILTDVTLR